MPPENESPLRSSTATGVVIVAGKGGVGKTTVTAVLARAATQVGRHVLVVELDGKPTLDRLVGAESGAERPVEVLHLSAPDALAEYLDEHGFGRVAKRLSRTGVIDVVGTAAPGIDDVVVLGKIKQIERSGAYDLILVDGPAAGHAVTFLTSASALGDAARGGPVKVQADDVLELLGDPERCSALLVTLPETTPVNETIETAYALEDEVGIRLGPVVVNGLDTPGTPEQRLAAAGSPELPDRDAAESALEALPADEASALRAALRFRTRRRAMEADAIERLGATLPLGLLTLPRIPVAGLTADDIATLAGELVAESSRAASQQATSTGDTPTESASRESIDG
ncbi:MAG: ArsA family ATPase [Actinomycetota bacterium]